MSSILCTMLMGSSSQRKTNNMSALGEYLEKRMRERNMTALHLEEVSGVPDATISRIRRGGKPKPDTVVRLAEAFDEDPVEWLLLAGYRQGSVGSASEEEEALLVLVRKMELADIIPLLAKLTPRNRAVVRRVIEEFARDQDDPQ